MYPYPRVLNQDKLGGFSDYSWDGFTETYISQQPTKSFTVVRYDINMVQLRQKPDPLLELIWGSISYHIILWVCRGLLRRTTFNPDYVSPRRTNSKRTASDWPLVYGTCLLIKISPAKLRRVRQMRPRCLGRTAEILVTPQAQAQTSRRCLFLIGRREPWHEMAASMVACRGDPLLYRVLLDPDGHL